VKVALIGPYPVDPDTRSKGVEVVTMNLARELQDLGEFDLEVISSTRGVSSQRQVVHEGVRVHYVPASRRGGNLSMRVFDGRRIAGKLDELAPDIAHFQLHFEYPYLVGPPPCSVVATVHGIVYREVLFDRTFPDRLRRWPRVWLERLTLARLEHLICVTDYVGTAIQHLTHAHRETIYNPLPDHYFDLEDTSRDPVILFVGSIIERKNVIGLVKAFAKVRKQVPGARLHLVGPLDEEAYVARVLDTIRVEEVEGEVRLLGRLSEEPLLDEYRGCAVVASASYEETAGLVFQQGLAAGVPAVGTAVGGVPEIVRDGVTGFVVPVDDVEAFADRLGRLLTDRGLRARMGAMARESAQAFRGRRVARQTADVYARILGGTPRESPQ